MKRGSKCERVKVRLSNWKVNGSWFWGRVSKRRVEEVKVRTLEMLPSWFLTVWIWGLSWHKKRSLRKDKKEGVKKTSLRVPMVSLLIWRATRCSWVAFVSLAKSWLSISSKVIFWAEDMKEGEMIMSNSSADRRAFSSSKGEALKIKNIQFMK